MIGYFYWKTTNVLFSRYLDFCIFVNTANFKIYDVIIDTAAHFDCLCEILSSIKRNLIRC